MHADAVAEKIAGRRLLVLGDVMLDRYVTGAADRLSPEAPVAILRPHRQVDFAGGAANTAANIVALGAQARLIGVVGVDAEAAALGDAVAAAGVQADLLRAETPTTLKERFLAGHHQLLRVDRDADRSVVEGLDRSIVDRVSLSLRDVDVLVVSDYAKGVCGPAVLDQVIQAARAAAVAVVVDPKLPSFDAYRGCTVITPNVAEAARAVGEFVDAGDALQRISAVTDSDVLLTRGAEGMALLTDGEVVHVPTHARRVYDVTGAGDTVVAALGCALAGGVRMRDAVEFAALAAAVSVSIPGTVAVTADQVVREAAG